MCESFINVHRGRTEDGIRLIGTLVKGTGNRANFFPRVAACSLSALLTLTELGKTKLEIDDWDSLIQHLGSYISRESELEPDAILLVRLCLI